MSGDVLSDVSVPELSRMAVCGDGHVFLLFLPHLTVVRTFATLTKDSAW